MWGFFVETHVKWKFHLARTAQGSSLIPSSFHITLLLKTEQQKLSRAFRFSSQGCLQLDGYPGLNYTCQEREDPGSAI